MEFHNIILYLVLILTTAFLNIIVTVFSFTAITCILGDSGKAATKNPAIRYSKGKGYHAKMMRKANGQGDGPSLEYIFKYGVNNL